MQKKNLHQGPVWLGLQVMELELLSGACSASRTCLQHHLPSPDKPHRYLGMPGGPL